MKRGSRKGTEWIQQIGWVGRRKEIKAGGKGVKAAEKANESGEKSSERAGCVWRQPRGPVEASTKVTGGSRDGG